MAASSTSMATPHRPCVREVQSALMVTARWIPSDTAWAEPQSCRSPRPVSFAVSSRRTGASIMSTADRPIVTHTSYAGAIWFSPGGPVESAIGNIRLVWALDSAAIVWRHAKRGRPSS